MPPVVVSAVRMNRGGERGRISAIIDDSLEIIYGRRRDDINW